MLLDIDFSNVLMVLLGTIIVILLLISIANSSDSSTTSSSSEDKRKIRDLKDQEEKYMRAMDDYEFEELLELDLLGILDDDDEF